MCWTKKLVCFFLNVAVRRRPPPPPPLLRHARKRTCRARSARMLGVRHPAKMKRDCFFLHANIFQMTHSLQNIRLTKNISHNTASRYLDILRGMITYRHIQPSHKSWVNKSTTLESKGKILVGF